MNLVVVQRIGQKQSLGDGGYLPLSLAIRAHGNLTENAAIFVTTLSLLEMMGGNSVAVAVLGSAFLIARIAHAFGLSRTDEPNTGRLVGALGTLLTMVAAGLYLAWVAIIFLTY